MARINIEEKWWGDPRRTRLIARVGSVDLADGMAVSFWRASQEFDGEAFEFGHLFEKDRVEVFLSAGLLTIDGEKIYVKGSKDAHEWVATRRSAGSKGGKARHSKSNDLPEAEAKQIQASAKHKASTSQASSSSSCSFSDSKENTYIKPLEEKTQEPPLQKELKLLAFPETSKPEKKNYDFEAIYKIYPNKEGKSDGMKKCKIQIKTDEDFEDLRKAVQNYAFKVKDTEKRFMKYFSSFMTSWRDHVEVEKDQTLPEKYPEFFDEQEVL